MRGGQSGGVLAHLRTLQGYRRGQLVARAALIARRRSPLPLAVDQAPPTLVPAALGVLAERAAERFADAETAERLLEGRVRLLEEERPVASPSVWGDDPAMASHLWRFTLHYHEHLVPALSAPGPARACAHDLLASWLSACPPTAPALSLSWHPYVISSRVVPWALALHADPPARLRAALARSLWRQLRVVARHLERDIGGNHLLRNAKALAVGGALFEGGAAERMRRRGQRLLTACLADQLGADGGHVERSPTYQALVIEDALDALSVAHPHDDLDALRTLTGRALSWLCHLSPPRRPRPHLNDSSEGQAASTEHLAAHATAAGVSCPAWWEPWGLPRYRVLGDEIDRLILDAAPPSRPDLPYHTHADSLGIVLQVAGVPIVVDRGVADYEVGPARAWWRSTAAHSTLQIDGADSSEVRGAFRAGRLARTTLDLDDPREVVARHDGAGRARLAHVRHVIQTGPTSWRVIDLTPKAASFVARLHFAPGTTLSLEGLTLRAARGAARLAVTFPASVAPRLCTTPHAARLGRSGPAPTLELYASRPSLEIALTGGYLAETST